MYQNDANNFKRRMAKLNESIWWKNVMNSKLLQKIPYIYPSKEISPMEIDKKNLKKINNNKIE